MLLPGKYDPENEHPVDCRGELGIGNLDDAGLWLREDLDEIPPKANFYNDWKRDSVPVLTVAQSVRPLRVRDVLRLEAFGDLAHSFL